MTKILDLPLQKQWYNMIESGVKKEEYREIKPYWIKRLVNTTKKIIDNRNTIPTQYTHIRFRYGYTKRTMLFELENISIGMGNIEWGAPEWTEVFILKIGKRIQ